MPHEDGIDLVEPAVQADGAVLHDTAFGLEEEQVIEVEVEVGLGVGLGVPRHPPLDIAVRERQREAAETLGMRNTTKVVDQG